MNVRMRYETKIRTLKRTYIIKQALSAWIFFFWGEGEALLFQIYWPFAQPQKLLFLNVFPALFLITSMKNQR